MTTPPPNNGPHEDPIRPHTFDGIQEYDKRLPNWWLNTLYATIAFAVVYWMQYAHSTLVPTDGEKVAAALARIEAARLSSASSFDDATLWRMSRNPNVVTAGRATYQTLCVSCHGERLTGGVGANLVDRTWVHGGRPTAVLATAMKGVPAKGMPAWEPMLGGKKVSEVVAYILSYHDQNEPEMTSVIAGQTIDPRGTN